MTAGQLAIVILAGLYLLGASTAVYTAATTWHDSSHAPVWWAYPVLVVPALIWPAPVIVFAVSKAYQGEVSKKSVNN